jgi:glycosyltransferase involved in cell wall biosynthesis
MQRSRYNRRSIRNLRYFGRGEAHSPVLRAPETTVNAVTVLLPIRNGEPWIHETLESLRTQTLTDFELLVIDDGCTDRSIDIVRSAGLPSLRVLQGPQAGLAAALALGVRETETELVFRQDQDDISLPDRLATQVEFLAAHPTHVAVGSNADVVDDQGHNVGRLRQPLTHEAISLRLCIMSPMVHPSVAMRRDAVLEAGNYWSPSSAPFPEDFHLWGRLARVGMMANLPRPLIHYRLSPSGVSRTHWPEIAVAAGEIAARNMATWLGRPALSDSERELVAMFHYRDRRISTMEALRVESLLISARAASGRVRVAQGFPISYYLRPLIWHLRGPRS